jgi:predicted Rossmann fold nucleotide-binding protein DprA/Smf involved in DNA uptake
MALGIDSVSASAALAAKGRTVAVLGCGIDVVYPKEHKTLRDRIIERGAVITEYPPSTEPRGFNFPVRNRIISGLSAATVVIEGKEKSGARITASYTLEQNRKLYALPGNIGSENSEITSLLLKNGAVALTSADDIVRDFQDRYPGIINPFNLKTKISVDLMEALRRYSVVAVTASDDIFPMPMRREKTSNGGVCNKREEIDKNSVVVDNDSVVEPHIDSRAFEIYKKIPTSGACSVESLIDSSTSLRDVMKHLLKLEIGHFIKMLPGDRVSRKFNSER